MPNDKDECYCPIEILNIARNCLGFKTGAYIMNLLINPEVKQYTRMRSIDLSYNTISLLVQNSVKKLLSETHYSA
jgi:intergrase/recombinase